MKTVPQRYKLDPAEFAMPCWLEPDGMPPPMECVAFPNGILHLPTKVWHQATPNFLNTTVLPYEYDAEATCPLWIQTLDQWFPPKDNGEPADEVLLLQEIYGYLCSMDTRAQAMFFFLGFPGSGKSTAATVARAIVGAQNGCSPVVRSIP